MEHRHHFVADPAFQHIVIGDGDINRWMCGGKIRFAAQAGGDDIYVDILAADWKAMLVKYGGKEQKARKELADRADRAERTGAAIGGFRVEV